MLASIGTRGKAPYRSVLTHGFVVDGEGKKYSKSAKNYVPPDKVLKEHGAEILRLWVAAEDYRSDIRVSDEILKRLVEAYRKIRNTCRYLLGNLYDFDPNLFPRLERGSPPFPKRDPSEIDKYVLHSLQKLVLRVSKAYEEFNFHIIFHELNRFCTVDLSAFYLDILKDRLYASAKNDPQRRAAQFVLSETASVLARLMAPILSFTAEEVWSYLPSFAGKEQSVHLASFPEPQPARIDESLSSRWGRFRELRDEIMKALEKARADKVIGSGLEAKVIWIAEGEPETLLDSFQHQLPTLFIVSQVEKGLDIPETAYRSPVFPTLFVKVEKADGKKCLRCWNYSRTVGTLDPPDLCERCRRVIGGAS